LNGVFYMLVNGRKSKCHYEIVWIKSEKCGASAVAGSAYDTVQGDETVRVLQALINGKDFMGIELGIDYKSVLALATVPAVAASVQLHKV
jgi:hypothetical protein